MSEILTRAKYAGLDFDTLADDHRGRLQVKFAADFNDFSLSSLGMVLLDMTAFGLDTLSFYLDRRATDTYLVTARSRSAVSRLTRQLGYKMRSAVASSVDLEVNLKVVPSTDIPIPKGFQFKGPNELIFEAGRETIFPVGSSVATKKTIPCYEGETVQETFVSNGTANQSFKLRRVPANKFVSSGTVTVTVDGVAHSESEFLQFEATNQFEVGYNDDPPTIRFGDGFAGTIPPNTASIVVTYVASRGKSGIVVKNTITKEQNALVVNLQTVALVINNPAGSVGGDDAESLESAKAYAPKVFKSREVAVTQEDYEALSGSFADPLYGRVAVAQAISTRASVEDLALVNYVESIRAAVSAPSVPVTNAIIAATDGLDDIDTALTASSTEISTISTKIGTSVTNLDAAAATTRSLKNYATEIFTDSQDIIGFASPTGTLRTAVNAIAVAGSDQLTTGTKNNLLSYIDRINQEATTVQTNSNTVKTLADNAVLSLGTVKLDLEEIGSNRNLNPATTSVSKLDSLLVRLSNSGTVSLLVVGVRTNLISIDAEVDLAIDTVETNLDGIMGHVGTILSADCKSNVVSVPILARDANGFYTAPSTGLVKSLQDYLDARKEVTQTVVVTSGDRFLVRIKLTVRVGVLPGFNLDSIKAACEAVVDGILRDRKFGVSLFLSDISDRLFAITGISFVNVKILGHYDTDGVSILTSKLDSDGNLIVDESDIITKGIPTNSVVVTSERVI